MKLGCMKIEGYYFGEPMTVNQLMQWIDNHQMMLS